MPDGQGASVSSTVSTVGTVSTAITIEVHCEELVAARLGSVVGEGADLLTVLTVDRI
jgi:hypothetical protein